MKKLILGGLTLATLAVLCSTTGCATAPEETPAEAEPSATSEDALGRDPANCYFHHRYRKYNTTCTWANATWNQKTASISDRPGKSAIHHSPDAMKEAPSATMMPHSGVGGRTPRPMKESPAALRMA